MNSVIDLLQLRMLPEKAARHNPNVIVNLRQNKEALFYVPLELGVLILWQRYAFALARLLKHLTKRQSRGSYLHSASAGLR